MTSSEEVQVLAEDLAAKAFPMSHSTWERSSARWVAKEAFAEGVKSRTQELVDAQFKLTVAKSDLDQAGLTITYWQNENEKLKNKLESLRAIKAEGYPGITNPVAIMSFEAYQIFMEATR